MAKPNNQNPPAGPSVEDVTAIGNAAAGAAEETSQAGGTADEAGTAAAAAADAEARARGIELPEKVIQQIARASAAATVAELANQRAIVAPEDDDQADDDQADEPAEPAAETGEKPPHKATLAERFLSGYNR